MLLNKLTLYYNTLKYLKLKQIWFRLARFLFPPKIFFLHPKIAPRPRKIKPKWKQTLSHKTPILSESPLTFNFLNCQGTVVHPEDWNAPNRTKLWLYNLHYHDFLLSNLEISLKNKIINQWIKQNPWPTGIAWEPYPLSLRIVNWIKYFLSERAPHSEELKSLYLQCFSLDNEIEYHLLGNHLFENAKALFFAGLFFDTKDSNKWFNKGISILKEQLEEQILEDGGHFERSPMYHVIILEGLLDIYQLSLIAEQSVDSKKKQQLQKLEQKLRKIIPEMLRWLSSLTHPDKEIAFFNDSTFDVAPAPHDIYRYGESLGFKTPSIRTDIVYLKASGFARVENKDALILADIGSVGPSYIPGHAHAETLSFEVSLRGKRLFVNSGISTYTACPERDYQRGTLAHNTVSINGKNSSRVWSSFRVAERATAFDVQMDSQESHLFFTASHDGYKRLKYGLIHKREWFLSEKIIRIKDSFLGTGVPEVIASYHLHPHWSIASQNKNVINLISSGIHRGVQVKFPQHAKIKIEPYDYAIGFNKKKKGLCLKACLTSQILPYYFETEVRW